MMNLFLEQRAGALHLALGISTFPTHSDLLRLVEWLEGVVSVVYADIPVPMCLHRSPVAARIVMPYALEDQPLTLSLAHEIGHALSSVGMGALLRQASPGDPRVLRLARVCDASDERLAREFVYAWCLPARFVPGHSDYDLCELANVSIDLVRARRERLGQERVRLSSVPPWSAAHTYRVVVVTSRSLLYAVKRGSAQPAYDFPSERKYLEADATQINLDLLALTTAEFEVKYLTFTAEPPQERRLDLNAIQQRLGAA